MNAGFAQSDLKVVFEEEQCAAADLTPSSLREAFRNAIEVAHLLEARIVGGSVRPKVLTLDAGATLTLQIHREQNVARAILSQHGGEFA